MENGRAPVISKSTRISFFGPHYWQKTFPAAKLRFFLGPLYSLRSLARPSPRSFVAQGLRQGQIQLPRCGGPMAVDILIDIEPRYRTWLGWRRWRRQQGWWRAKDQEDWQVQVFKSKYSKGSKAKTKNSKASKGGNSAMKSKMGSKSKISEAYLWNLVVRYHRRLKLLFLPDLSARLPDMKRREEG